MEESSGFQVSGSAPENYERYNPVIMAPFIEAVLTKVAIRPGDAVLDVACGTGLVARRAATLTGPTGRVVGLDINPGMLRVARASSVPDGCAIEWREGSALDLPLSADEFHVILCQQGVQFFPDLALAMREMARVAAPGARLAVSFWAASEEQPYMQAQREGLQRAIGSIGAIAGAFELDPAYCCELLTAAGFREASAERVTATVSLPPMESFALGQASTLPVAPAIAALDQQQRLAYVRHMEESLSANRTEAGTYACPFVSWVVSAMR